MIDVNNRQFVADMVRANYIFNWQTNFADALSIVDSYGGRTSRLDYRRDLPAEVNWFFCETPAALFLFFGGVNDQAARTGCIRGWQSSADLTLSHGFNKWAFDIAARWQTTWPVIKDYTSRQVIMVGQSGGGLVAEATNYFGFGKNVRPTDVHILTGTPRGLHHDYDGFYPADKIYRFMMLNDPICSLPPRFREWPELCNLFGGLATPLSLAALLEGTAFEAGNFTVNVWPGFHHPPGGIIITEDGFSFARNDLYPPRSTTPLIGGAIESVSRMLAYPAHEMMTYVAAIAKWAEMGEGSTGTETAEQPGEVAHGDWGNQVEFFCPQDDAGNIVNSPNGSVQTMGHIVQTGSTPLTDGSLGGSLYLRGNLVAVFPTVGKARTAASKLNRFLAKLPSANEVSTSGLSDGMLQYLSEAAIGGGVDRRPVKVVT